MKNNPTVCDPKRIEWFFSQQMSDVEQTKFESHLDECENCRDRLEQKAAAPNVWSGIREAWNDESLEERKVKSASKFESKSESDCENETSGMEAPFSLNTVLSILSPTDDDKMLGRLGNYEVIGVVGSGGMGVVLKALDPSLNRFVAIKVLAPHLGSSGAARQRFSREAQAAAAVVHDSVIEIYGVANASGLPYLVMPYIKGPSLQKRLDAEGSLAAVEILRVGTQAASGLAAAHSQGLVHRDVKPSNILLADGIERVKITDFGLARAADDASLTKTGIIAGTPQFMSPEQARGDSIDQRSDLFSLGSVLYMMCTGRPPFRAETSYGVLRRITDTDPSPIRDINPEIPDWLCQIVRRLMMKDPDQRFTSAQEVAQLMEDCLAHAQQPTAIPLPAAVVIPPDRRVGIATWAALGAFAVTVLVLSLIFLPNFWPQPLPGPGTSGTPSSTTIAKNDSGHNETSLAPSAMTSIPEPKTGPVKPAPERLKFFESLTTGNGATIAMSPDGKQIAIANGNPTRTMFANGRSKPTGGWKPTLQILDADSGKAKLTIDLNMQVDDVELSESLALLEASSLAFSPDGKSLAVGSSVGQLKLFDTSSGEMIREFDDEKSRLADEKTPENWKSLKRAMGMVRSLAFSPDGKSLATIGGSFADFSESLGRVDKMGFRGTAPGRLKLWDVETGNLQHDLVGHNDHANAVAFSPDGKYLASAGRWMSKNDRWGSGVILWNARSGNELRSIHNTPNGGTRALAFSPDSKTLAIGTQRFTDDTSTGGVSLVHVSSGITEWLTTVPGWAKPIGFSADGTRVVVLCGGKSIRFLDVKQGTTKHEIKPVVSNKGEEKPTLKWLTFAIANQDRKIAIAGVKKKEIGVEVWSINGADSEVEESPVATLDESAKDRKSGKSKGTQLIDRSK